MEAINDELTVTKIWKEETTGQIKSGRKFFFLSSVLSFEDFDDQEYDDEIKGEKIMVETTNEYFVALMPFDKFEKVLLSYRRQNPKAVLNIIAN